MDDKIERIAMVCHEAMRTWYRAHGDLSEVPWLLVPDARKASLKRQIVYHLENPNAPPSATHDAWRADKVRAGWRHGRFKDAGAKTHPGLVRFEDLPEQQQAKHRLLKATVHALA